MRPSRPGGRGRGPEPALSPGGGSAPAQADWVAKNLEELAQAGLVLEPFGGASFVITAVPACLAHADLEAVVAEAVEALAPSKSGTRPQEVREQALQFMACRGAVKAGEILAPEAIQALLVQLDEIRRLLPLPPRAAPVAPDELPGHPPELSPVKDGGRERAKGEKGRRSIRLLLTLLPSSPFRLFPQVQARSKLRPPLGFHGTNYPSE